METVTKVKDILDICKEDVLSSSLQKLANIRTIFLYGSYAYQNLDRRIEEFSESHGENGVLDKKPDFIVVVSRLEESLNDMAQKCSWSSDDLEKILSLRRDTPFYFNIETSEEYELKLKESTEIIKFPYKIGIIEEERFFDAPKKGSHNIYLPSRLSKCVNVLFEDESIKPKIKTHMNNIKDYFVNLTLSILPKKFSGEEFMEKYLKVTYLAEAYRVFDLVKKKHLKILESEVYDFGKAKVVSMREQLKEMIKPILYQNKNVMIYSVGDCEFYDTVFRNNTRKNRIKTLYDFTMFNIFSAKVSFHKNRITNSIGGGNNFSYVARKFR